MKSPQPLIWPCLALLLAGAAACGDDSQPEGTSPAQGASQAGAATAPAPVSEGPEGAAAQPSEGAEGIAVPPNGDGQEGTEGAEGIEGAPAEGNEGKPTADAGTPEGAEGQAEGAEGTPTPDAGSPPETDAGAGIPLCPELDEFTDPLQRPGATADGRVILPDGRAISPQGATAKVGIFPMNSILTKDEKFLVVTHAGNADHALMVIDTATMAAVHTEPAEALYTGMAFGPDGKLYVAGGQSNAVHVFTLDAQGKLALVEKIPVPDFPTGVFVTPDNQRLYVTRNLADATRRIHLAGKTFEDIASGPKYPYDVYETPDASKLFISNWSIDSAGALSPAVTYFDLAAGAKTGSRIAVGKNPEQLLPSRDGKSLYVVATDGDQVDRIDLAAATVAESYELDEDPRYTVAPVAVAESPGGKFLYVTSVARNTIEVFDVATKKVLGSIPTSNYPVDVEISADGKTLFWVAAKGEGSGPSSNKEHINGMIRGTVGKTPVPDPATLADWTAMAQENLRRRSQWTANCRAQGGVVPMQPGDDTPIKHVVLIVKENQTYDMLLSDLEFGQRDTSLLENPEVMTPNQHALARQFVNMDSFYSESETSTQGHIWLQALTSNDYVEKVWPANYRDGIRQELTGVEAATYTEDGFYHSHLLRHKIEIANYGEIVGAGADPKIMQRTSLKFGFYNTSRSDVEKAQVFIDDLNAGKLAPYTFILLPNDHTNGRSPGNWTPEWMVIDNDYATGLVVEAITKSPFWESTMIFITEDDPQGGYDHVDAHRTIGIVVSPWTKRQYLSSVHYTFMSFFRTTGLILGAPPFNVYDEAAAPFFDIWTDKPDLTPYTAIRPKDWDNPTFNYEGEPGSWESKDMNFSFPDLNPTLRELVHGTKKAAKEWRKARGYPVYDP